MSVLPFQYVDYVSPRPSDYRNLARRLKSLKYTKSRSLCLIYRVPGEYCIAPINLETFDEFIHKNCDFSVKLQYSRDTVVATIMYPPHDGAANAIALEICRSVDQVLGSRSRVQARTGRITPVLVYF